MILIVRRFVLLVAFCRRGQTIREGMAALLSGASPVYRAESRGVAARGGNRNARLDYAVGAATAIDSLADSSAAPSHEKQSAPPF